MRVACVGRLSSQIAFNVFFSQSFTKEPRCKMRNYYTRACQVKLPMYEEIVFSQYVGLFLNIESGSEIFRIFPNKTVLER